MSVHELKCWPEYFEAIKRGEKTFEVRRDDDREAAFCRGDYLHLREWSPVHVAGDTGYTERDIMVLVTYVLREDFKGVLPGWVVMGIKVLA